MMKSPSTKSPSTSPQSRIALTAIDPTLSKKAIKGYEKVIPLGTPSPATPPRVHTKGGGPSGGKRVRQYKWMVEVIGCSMVSIMIVSAVIGGLYLFVTSRLKVSLDKQAPISYLSMGLVCRSAYKDGEMEKCVFELEDKYGQCSGIMCTSIVWNLIVDDTTGVVTFRMDMVDVNVNHSTTAHCGKEKWCRMNKCQLNRKLEGRWKRPIKFVESKWIEDPDSPCFSDDRTAESREAWIEIRKGEKCACQPNNGGHFRVVLHRCDNNDDSEQFADHESRPKPCTGSPLKLHGCSGECKRNVSGYYETCGHGKEKHFNGNCLVQCVDHGYYLWAPPGTNCFTEDGRAGLCMLGLCYSVSV